MGALAVAADASNESTTVTGACPVTLTCSAALATVAPEVKGPPRVAGGSADSDTVTCFTPVQLIAEVGVITPAGDTVTGVAVVPTSIVTEAGRRRKPSASAGVILSPAVAPHETSKSTL